MPTGTGRTLEIKVGACGSAQVDTELQLRYRTQWVTGFTHEKRLSAHSLEVNLRYNQNTIEQTILAAIAWLGLAMTLPHEKLILIAGMAILFAVGRATFWIGYLIHPIARTFGMTLTVIPTIIAFAALTWHAFS